MYNLMLPLSKFYFTKHHTISGICLSASLILSLQLQREKFWFMFLTSFICRVFSTHTLAPYPPSPTALF